MQVRELRGLLPRDRILVFLAFTAWFVLFGAGLVVNSAPFRDALNNGGPLFSLLWAWFVVLTVYTPTNVALLSLFSGLMGALGARAELHKTEEAKVRLGMQPTEPAASPDAVDEDQGEDYEEWVDKVNPFLSAFIRGFFVYLILISGLLILIENPFATTSPEQYVRLAGLVSVLSFVANYNPGLFGKFFERITQLLEARAIRGRQT